MCQLLITPGCKHCNACNAVRQIDNIDSLAADWRDPSLLTVVVMYRTTRLNGYDREYGMVLVTGGPAKTGKEMNSYSSCLCAEGR